MLAKLRSVGQVSQCIVVSHMGELRLIFPPLGNVLEGRDPSASVHRLFDHAERISTKCFHNPGTGTPSVDVRHHARKKLVRIADKLSSSLLMLEEVQQGS